MKGDKIMEQIILEKINLEEVVTELLKGNNVYFKNDGNFMIIIIRLLLRVVNTF